MAIKILLDRSHLEELYDLPKQFDSYDYVFFYAEETLLSHDLTDYDVVILGNPCAYVKNKLKLTGQFLAEEYNRLVQYVKGGGSLFVTWGPPQEKNPHRAATIKLLSKLLGITHVFDGFLFQQDSSEEKAKIIIAPQIKHPLFQNCEQFARDHASLFLTTEKCKTVAFSPPNCNYYLKPTKIKEHIKPGPILIERQYFKGKIIACSSTKMFSAVSPFDEVFEMNRQFFNSIIRYLAPQEDPFDLL